MAERHAKSELRVFMATSQPAWQARLKGLWCRIWDHDEPISFHAGGVYWCGSAGPYDCICLRCGSRWEDTPSGQEALIRSMKRDPRHGGSL